MDRHLIAITIDAKLLNSLVQLLRYIVTISLNKGLKNYHVTTDFLGISSQLSINDYYLHSTTMPNKSLEEICYTYNLCSCDHHQTLHKHV